MSRKRTSVIDSIPLSRVGEFMQEFGLTVYDVQKVVIKHGVITFHVPAGITGGRELVDKVQVAIAPDPVSFDLPGGDA